MRNKLKIYDDHIHFLVIPSISLLSRSNGIISSNLIKEIY